MTKEDIIRLESYADESLIQHTCVRWFRHTFARIEKMTRMLWAVPNGGLRDSRTARTMAYEGQLAGVADLVLSIPGRGGGILFVEMKRPGSEKRRAGRQTPEQKEWQKAVESYGHTYAVCYGLLDFIHAVCLHLGLDEDYHLELALRRYPIYRQDI